MSLKAKKVEKPSSSDEESDDEGPFALVACGVSKILKNEKKIQE